MRNVHLAGLSAWDADLVMFCIIKVLPECTVYCGSTVTAAFAVIPTSVILRHNSSTFIIESLVDCLKHFPDPITALRTGITPLQPRVGLGVERPKNSASTVSPTIRTDCVTRFGRLVLWSYCSFIASPCMLACTPYSGKRAVRAVCSYARRAVNLHTVG